MVISCSSSFLFFEDSTDKMPLTVYYVLAGISSAIVLISIVILQLALRSLKKLVPLGRQSRAGFHLKSFTFMSISAIIAVLLRIFYDLYTFKNPDDILICWFIANLSVTITEISLSWNLWNLATPRKEIIPKINFDEPSEIEEISRF